MKLFISDYDGTYLRSMYEEELQLRANSEAVSKWRQLGGLFGFSTGRIFPLIELELKKYPIETDVMVVANGALVLDRGGRVIYQHLLSNSLVEQLVDYLTQKSELSFICSDGWDGYHSEKIIEESSMKEVILSLKEAGYFNLTLQEVMSRGIAQFSIVDLDSSQVNQLTQELKDSFGEVLTVYPNRSSIDLSPKGVSKATGIQEVLNYLGLKPDQVVCMGDSWNDIEMIQTYTGFTVPEAPGILKASAIKYFSSVNQALSWMSDHATSI